MRCVPYFLLSLLVITNYAVGYQFDHDSCKSMAPSLKTTGVKVSSPAHNGHHHRRSAGMDEDTAAEVEDDDVSEGNSDGLKVGTRPGPFIVALSETTYRRNRPLQVSILGPEFNGFMVQARSKDVGIVGVFESLPASAATLDCDSSADTIIHKDTGGKVNLSFTWRAPDDDVGVIFFMATVIQKDTYWSHIHSPKLDFNPIPPSLKNCGKTESCYRQSSIADCSPEQCDYVVITKLIEDKTVEFTIGAKIKEQSGYVAVGYTLDNKKMTHMDISACIKNGTIVDTQQFLAETWQSGPRHYHREVDVISQEFDGDMIWCRFSRPLHNPDVRLADLTQTLHQTFFMGAVNDSDTNDLQIILPPTDQMNFLAEAWDHNNNVVVMHLISPSSAVALSDAFALTVSTLLVLLLTHF